MLNKIYRYKLQGNKVICVTFKDLYNVHDQNKRAGRNSY